MNRPEGDLDVRPIDLRQGKLPARADLGPFLQQDQEHAFEWSILLSRVDLPDDPTILATAEGHIALRRHRHGLTMNFPDEQVGDVLPRRRVRHSFEAALCEEADGAVLLHSLRLGPPQGFTQGIDEPDRGVTWASLRAIKPDLIVSAILTWIRAEPAMLERLVRLDKGRWTESLERQQEYAALIARIDATRAKPRRRRREGLTSDELYRDVALLCINAFDAGQRRGFHKLVAEAYGDIPLKTAADWIGKARAAEWLGPAPAGRAVFTRGPRLQSTKGEDHA